MCNSITSTTFQIDMSIIICAKSFYTVTGNTLQNNTFWTPSTFEQQVFDMQHLC